MAAKSVLGDIKRDLDLHVGQRIRLKANKGRKKVVERNGVLERTYPNIFVVKLDEAETNERRVSFSYADLLTEAVELVVCGESGDLKIECHAR
ncbi:MAG: Veg family protein [Firmicutes bacterium]|nr:Veg family protein [Bacillota bacterium]